MYVIEFFGAYWFPFFVLFRLSFAGIRAID